MTTPKYDSTQHPTGPCAACQYPQPITAPEIRTRIAAGEEGWGPGWVLEPIVTENAPPHEVADLAAQRAFHEANEKLSGQTARFDFLDEAGFLKPLAEVQAVLDTHVPGAKADAGKLDYTLVPTELEAAVCEIMMFGARKYTRDGWRSVPNAHVRYLAALERHIKAFKSGEDCDPESGLHHLAHAACNLAFLLYFLRNGQDVGSWRFEEERYNGT